MAQEFKAILGFLYEEFGDDLVDAGKTLIGNKLKEEKSKEPLSSEVGRKANIQTNSCPDRSSAAQEKADGKGEDPRGEISKEVADSRTYCDAKDFEDRIISGMKVEAVAVMNSGDVAGAVRDLIFMAGEVRKFEEAQSTVRLDIAAQRDITLANIEMQKTALMVYLDKSFDERKESFQMLFSVVDDALAKDNMQELAVGLEGIISLADSSPFKDLRTIEETANALTDPNHKWDF